MQAAAYGLSASMRLHPGHRIATMAHTICTAGIVAAMALCWSGASAQEGNARRPSAKQAVCTFTAGAIPDDTIVIAAGAYGGRELPFQIGQSGHQATQFDVDVHADTPVALLLGAYEPAIWHIRWSRGTRIVAVFATGYHRQAVAGLPAGTPVITTSYDEGRPCGGRYMGGESGLEWINPAARTLFGRAAMRVYTRAPAGRIDIIESARPAGAYASSPDRPPESFRDRSAPPAGDDGLKDAVARGLIRPLKTGDVDAVRAHYRTLAARRDGGVVDIPPVAGTTLDAPPPVRIPRLSPFRGYVVLKPFVFPAGLYGAHSAQFMVPRGVPSPTGEPGHSLVVDLNRDPPCAGPMCGE
jgi:hypothetical protein